VGGQNPIEPAKCGCKIYHGPYISNFKEIYGFLREKNIAYEVSNEIDLSQNLIKDFNNRSINKRIVDEINNHGEQILDLTTKEILKLSR
jgi:3-deoxy-D-manno-octulosonic-acid transferase